uniref:NTF2 domain-containing protein n=1 Tax=Rhodosorus marinus TaxID=101924 RepID=A0A7S3EGW1_9RHOD|mmetsp:Transcript_35440/g.140899  ORF Transcript_35440/g.140899 Transcript_35440/m.140899 type:complete len:474 (+) Transcript_35440:3022-4443(+)
MEEGGDGRRQVYDHDLIARQFARIYYRVLSGRPVDLHRFYKEHSLSSFADGPEEPAIVLEGDREIQDNPRTSFHGYAVQVVSIDSQWSDERALALLVHGKMHRGTDDSVGRSFVHSFGLSPQTHGWYVRNDMFRFLENEEEVVNEAMMLETVSPSQSMGTLGTPRGDENQDMESDITVGADAIPLMAEANLREDSNILQAVHIDHADRESSANEPAQAEHDPMDESVSDIVPVSGTGSGSGSGEPPRFASSSQKVPPRAPNTNQNSAKASYASVVAKIRLDAVGSQHSDQVSTTSGGMQESQRTDSGDFSTADEGGGVPVIIVHGLYINQLPSSRQTPLSTLASILRLEFERYGRVKNLDMRISRGYAFLDYESEDSVNAALDAWRNGPPTLTDKTLRNIKVQARRPPPTLRQGSTSRATDHRSHTSSVQGRRNVRSANAKTGGGSGEPGSSRSRDPSRKGQGRAVKRQNEGK